MISSYREQREQGRKGSLLVCALAITITASAPPVRTQCIHTIRQCRRKNSALKVTLSPEGALFFATLQVCAVAADETDTLLSAKVQQCSAGNTLEHLWAYIATT